MATEAAWLNGNNLEKEEIKKRKEKTEKWKKSLDTHRPSHGRTLGITSGLQPMHHAKKPDNKNSPSQMCDHATVVCANERSLTVATT